MTRAAIRRWFGLLPNRAIWLFILAMLCAIAGPVWLFKKCGGRL